MRTIIVGDPHGCHKELLQLLKKISFNMRKDRLLLLGDLVDRGPDSYQLLELAKRWRAKYPDHVLLIRGNHEQMIVEQSDDLERRMIWRLVGKGATLKSLRKNKVKMSDYIGWIEENMPIYFVEENYRCTHASVIDEDLSKNTLSTLVHDHSNTKKNEYTGKLTIVGHTPIPEPTHYDGSGAKEVGSPGIPLEYRQWHALPETGIICIDTGCAYGNKLTAMIIEDGRYYLDYVPGTCYYTGKNLKYIKHVKTFCACVRKVDNLLATILPWKEVKEYQPDE